MNKIDRYKILIRYAVKNKFAESQKDLGRKLGYSNESSMSQIINGKVTEPKDFTQRLCQIIPNLNITWINSGEGNMLLPEKGTQTENSTPPKEKPSVEHVPLLPLNAVGGTLVGFAEDSVRLQDCETVMAPIQGVDFAITIYGDSMSPIYPSGSRVFVQRIDPSSYIPWGSIFVLDTTNGIILKEVQPSSVEGCVSCHSLNQCGRYKDFDVPLKDIRGMFKVLACITAQW